MSNNKQQTAVEWFAFELSKLGLLPDEVPDDIYKQAKEMHEKETINFAQTWAAPSVNKEHLEYFYNETFKKQ